MHFFSFLEFARDECSLLSSGNKIPPHPPGHPRLSHPTNDDATVFHRNDRPLIASRVASFRAR